MWFVLLFLPSIEVVLGSEPAPSKTIAPFSFRVVREEVSSEVLRAAAGLLFLRAAILAPMSAPPPKMAAELVNNALLPVVAGMSGFVAALNDTLFFVCEDRVSGASGRA